MRHLLKRRVQNIRNDRFAFVWRAIVVEVNAVQLREAVNGGNAHLLVWRHVFNGDAFGQDCANPKQSVGPVGVFVDGHAPFAFGVGVEVVKQRSEVCAVVGVVHHCKRHAAAHDCGAFIKLAGVVVVQHKAVTTHKKFHGVVGWPRHVDNVNTPVLAI